MKRTLPLAIALIAVLAASAAPAAPALTPAHRAWLEEVTPIITKVEREVFIEAQDRRRAGQVHPVLLAPAGPASGHSGERVLQGLHGTGPLRRPVFRDRLVPARLSDGTGLLSISSSGSPSSGTSSRRNPSSGRWSCGSTRARRLTACPPTSTSSSTSPRGSGTTACITPGSRGPRSWSSPTSAPGRPPGTPPQRFFGKRTPSWRRPP